MLVLRIMSSYNAWLEFKRLFGLDLDYLNTYTEVEAVIVNEAPLRVGSGRGEGLGEADLPVVRGRDGVPFIPGSSLKGVLRSWLEVIHSPEDTCRVGDSSHECCSLKAELVYKLVKSVEKRFYKGLKLEAEEFKRAVEEIDLRNIAERYKECAGAREVTEKFANAMQSIAKGVAVLEVSVLVNRLRDVLAKEKLIPCIICRIFGNKALAAHVSISDARPTDGDVKTLIRTRVAIDRFTKTALPGALFDYEYIPEGYKWKFKIIAWNIDLGDKNGDASSRLRLLLENLASIGLFVGGMKSVGHGLLRLVVDESRVKVCRVENAVLKCGVKPIKEFLAQG
jgi:CRISPR/Cas system CSM-associated protein Csm3 (group 7 of RAMP superfamily)